MALGDEDRRALGREIRRAKAARYVEVDEQVAGRDYERSKDGRGVTFDDLPIRDRAVMLEDYVDWRRYAGLGLTDQEQHRIAFEAAVGTPPPGPAECERLPAEAAASLVAGPREQAAEQMPTAVEARALFAEMREDYSAAKERDTHGERFAEVLEGEAPPGLLDKARRAARGRSPKKPTKDRGIDIG